MDKHSPLSRAVRTLVFALAGVATAAAVIDWTTDWRRGSVIVALGVIAAVVAATLAYFQAVAGLTVSTPLQRAIVTFAQLEAAGLATIVVNDLSNATLLNTGQAVVRFTVSAALAAVASLVQNSAEDRKVA